MFLGRLSRKYDPYIITVISSVFFVALKIHQYMAFDLKGELSDYELTLWNTLNGNLLQMKCSNMSFFSEHFSPILLLLVPVYAIFQSPYTLLIVQGIFCALAILPLYYLVTKFTDLRWPPIAVSLAYFSSRIVNKGLMYDFHPEIFYPLLFFSLLLAYHKESWLLFYALLLLCASVKEDSFVAIVGLGLFILFSGVRKNWRYGVSVTAFGVIGLAAVLYLVIPYFRLEAPGGGYKFASYWAGYGANQSEIALNFLNPVRHFEVIFTPNKIEKMFKLFLDFAFLPLVHLPSAFFLVLPNWFMLYASDNDSLNAPSLYYGLLITPFLFYASLQGVRVISQQKFFDKNKVVVLLASVILLIQFADSRMFKLCAPSYWSIPARLKTAAEIIRSIPEGAAVSAQINLISHIKPHTQRTNFPNNIENAQYLVLDIEGDMWPLSKTDYENHLAGLRNNNNLDLVVEKDGFLLYKKKYHKNR